MTDQATLIVVSFCELQPQFLDNFFAGFGVISMKKMREKVALNGITGSCGFPEYYHGIRVRFESAELANKAYACLNQPAARNAHPLIRLVLFKEPRNGRTSTHLGVRNGALRLSIPSIVYFEVLYGDLSNFGTVSLLYLDEKDGWVAHYESHARAMNAIPNIKVLYPGTDIEKIVVEDHPLEHLELEIIGPSYFRRCIDFIDRGRYLMICVFFLGLFAMALLHSPEIPSSIIVMANTSITDSVEQPPPFLQSPSQDLPILADCQSEMIYSSEKMDLLVRDVISREARAVEAEAYEKEKNLEKSIKLREAEEEIAWLKADALLTASVVLSQRREIEEHEQRLEQYKDAIKMNGDFLLDMMD